MRLQQAMTETIYVLLKGYSNGICKLVHGGGSLLR